MDHSEGKSNPNHSVMVVDDDPVIRELLEVCITMMGHDVLVASDGREALSILNSAESNPDMIITDMQMPGMNGFEFVKKIRGDKKMLEVPVIISSANADLESDVISLGAQGYLKKPFELKTLQDFIQNYTHSKIVPA